MATAPKFVSPRKKPLGPGVKSWIDNVIVPALVREFLASEKKDGESSYDAPVVHRPSLKTARKENR
jgi:hypothetical protein